MGESETLGIAGSSKGGPFSTARGDGVEELLVSEDCVRLGIRQGGWFYSRFNMPFRTAARTSARSLSPPTILLLELELSVPELPARSGSPPLATLEMSREFRSRRGKPVLPPFCGFGSAFTLTRSLSASTVTIDTVAWLPSAASAVGTPITDFGLKRPAKERPLFFIPRPIFRIIIEAEEAVEEMDRLSVDP